MSPPPAHVERAAAVVQTWLDGEQKPTPKPREEIDKMSPAERLDYSRQFNQQSMPEWKDPRAAPVKGNRLA